jgi:hypothetical protein
MFGMFHCPEGGYRTQPRFHRISANLLDLGTPTSSLLQAMQKRERERGRSKNDCGRRETNPDEDEVFSPSDLQNRFRSSIVLVLELVLALVSAIACRGSICEGPQSDKLALMGLKPRAERRKVKVDLR